jgi:hypothetical protein
MKIIREKGWGGGWEGRTYYIPVNMCCIACLIWVLSINENQEKKGVGVERFVHIISQ